MSSADGPTSFALSIVANNGGTVSSLTRYNKLVYAAQTGALDEYPYDSVETHFEFELMGSPAGRSPASTDLVDYIDGLGEAGLLDISERTTPSGGVGYSYSITDDGRECLLDDPLPEDDRVAVESVCNLYGEMPLFELVERAKDAYYEQNAGATRPALR